VTKVAVFSTELSTELFNTEPWRTRLGTDCPRSAFPGTSVPGIGGGMAVASTVLPAVVRPVPRVQGKAGLAFPVPQPAVLMAQLGQPNNYIHMTSVTAVGEGAAGPPRYREPV
jgi:hypothetical protein